jgi:hypothetical protein
MIRNFIVAFFVLTAIGSSAAAQDSVKIKRIHQLMDVMGSGKLGVQVMSNVIDAFKKQNPNVDPQFWDELKKEINVNDLVNMVVPIYAKYFTDDDIQQMIAFYNSPIGKKYVASLPAITQESMHVGMEWGQQLAQKVTDKLKQKGY